MKIKKLLIIKPKITEDKDKDGKVVCTHYIYPDRYNAEHARHICYNFSGGDKLKGGHLAEGMVIYEAEESEIKALLKSHDKSWFSLGICTGLIMYLLLFILLILILQ